MEQLWVEAGIFLSHIGSESWISRANWTYTRSLIADYSPYYESGVKATWTASPKLTATFTLLNGWQNISETNANKAVGIRIDYTASDRLLLGYSNFLGNEAAEGSSSQLRFFHDIYGRLMLTPRLGVTATFDIGTQKKTGDDGARWYGLSVVGRLTATEHVALNARFERYADPDSDQLLLSWNQRGSST